MSLAETHATLLHNGPLGLALGILCIFAALWLLVARFIGMFCPMRVDTVREIALLVSGPLLVLLFSVAATTNAVAVYYWGTGVDTDFPLRFGLNGITVLCGLAILSLVTGCIAVCLPRKNRK